MRRVWIKRTHTLIELKHLHGDPIVLTTEEARTIANELIEAADTVEEAISIHRRDKWWLYEN